MKQFVISVVAPEKHKTQAVVAKGETFSDAMQNWHLENDRVGVSIMVDLPNGGREAQIFAVFRDEMSGEELISRVCRIGIWRKGGVKPYPPRDLNWAAQQLGVTVDKLQGPWVGEEQYDDKNR